MKINVKQTSKKILSYIVVYIGISLLFTSLMIATYMLPDVNIRYHVTESLETLEHEQDRYLPFFQEAGAGLDSFTDELMLNVSVNKGMRKSTTANAMENSYYFAPSESMYESLQIVALQDDITNNTEYSRYWHGIQVVLRPLLMFLNYNEIRYILMVATIVLVGIVFSMIGKQLGIRYSIAFAITISLMYFILIPMSLQYSSIFIVTLASMIAVLALYKANKENLIPILFFITGAFATFFDLLTYPLVSLGFPIVLATILESRKGTSLCKQILFIIKLGVLWAVGYSLLFFTKWVIASIILNENAIKVAIEKLLFRVNGNEIYVANRMDALRYNINTFFVPLAKVILTIIFIFWVVSFILYRKKLKDCKVVIPLLCIAVVPYIWYLVFTGHSSIHYFFTNRIQAMTLFAVLCAMGEMIDKNKIGRVCKKIGRNK